MTAAALAVLLVLLWVLSPPPVHAPASAPPRRARQDGAGPLEMAHLVEQLATVISSQVPVRARPGTHWAGRSLRASCRISPGRPPRAPISAVRPVSAWAAPTWSAHSAPRSRCVSGPGHRPP